MLLDNIQVFLDVLFKRIRMSGLMFQQYDHYKLPKIPSVSNKYSAENKLSLSKRYFLPMVARWFVQNHKDRNSSMSTRGYLSMIQAELST